MEYSETYQPRYALYIVKNGRHILVARFGSLAKLLFVEACHFEAGDTVYHDVNHA